MFHREHGAEAVAAVCLIILALKAALAAHLDTRLRNFLDGMDDMQVASQKLFCTPLVCSK